MLINLWYVADHSHNLQPGIPKRVRMLAHDFVLFRDSDGQAHCLSDVCIHRGASLAGGKQHDGTVACPYHGWRFDGGGRCRLIPSMGPDAKIPNRARVDAYPVQERYGLIWVFLGDLPEEERPPIFDDFAEYHDTETWRCIHGSWTFNANWQRVTENGMDSAHTHFIHPDFGNPEDPRVPAAEITETDWSGRAGRGYAAKEKQGSLGELLNESGRTGAYTDLQYHMSGLTVKLKQNMSERISQVIFSCKTPVDEYTTTTFFIQARNYLLEPDKDGERYKSMYKVFTEDQTVVETIQPKLVPDSMVDELSVVTDALPVSFRKKALALKRRGWAIDTAAMSPDHVTCIPSPARREDPRGWVFRPTPLIPADETMAVAAE